jgi:hypothetical protein
MAKKKVVPTIPLIDTVGDTSIIDLGPVEELKTESSLNYSDWNFIQIRRTDDPLFRWWGNLNSHWMSKLILSYESSPRLWKYKLFNAAQVQYEKYGDYYRVLDNSFGEPGADDIYETMEK